MLVQPLLDELSGGDVAHDLGIALSLARGSSRLVLLPLELLEVIDPWRLRVSATSTP